MDTLFINRKLGYFRWTAPTVRLTLALLPDLANFKQISTFTIPKTGSTTNNEATCKVQAGKVTGTLQFLVQGETYQFEARIFNWTFSGALSIDALLNPGNTPPANQAPSVIISGSASGTVGTQQSFQAIASDGDGIVAKVDLCLMADASTLTSFTVLDTDLYSPYVLNWTPSSAGNFPLRTRATDDDGATSFSSVLQVAVVVATQNPDPTPTPAGSFTLSEPRYVSTVVETTDGQFVRQLREGELLPAGTYPLTHDGTAADGSLLPLPATSYQVRAYSHKQSGAVADVFKGAIGNSSKYPAGNRGSRGFNPPDASLCVVLPTAVSLQVPTTESTPENPATQTLALPAGTAVVFETYGYTEGSLGIGFYLLTEPNVVYALPGYEASKLSGTHLAVLDNVLYVGTLCILGVYDPSINRDYTGPGVLAIDLTTFQDKTFDGNTNARTLYGQDHTYHLLATKHTQDGGKAITSLAAANGKLLVSFGLENRVQVIETSGYTTLQQNTITYPFASAASGSTLWLGHEASFPEAVEQFTVNADGTFTRTSTAALAGITHLGYLAYSWDQQSLLAMDVAENAVVFFGSYTDQGELLIPRRIYYLRDRTFRYVGAAGQYLTRAQWDALPDTGNEVFQPMATFMPSTSNHRLRLFNAATGATGAVYGEGDYVTNALVTNMKWMFCSQEGIAGDSENCFVCALPDGGTLLRDKGNSRSIRLNASGQYVSRKSSTGSTYNIAGDSNDPTKHWIRLRRYWQDLSVTDLTLDGVAWGLEANYTAYSHPAYPPYFSKQVVTTGGRTFAFRRNSYTYQQVLWEVTGSGALNWNLPSKDLGSAILADGSWLEVDNYEQNGGARRLTRRLLTGYDVNGRPQLGSDTVVTTLPDTAQREDPRLVEAPTSIGANGEIWVYDGGLARLDTDRGGLGAFHVGKLQANSTGWKLRTMPATEINVDVENPLGNVFYSGSSILNGGTFSATVGDVSVFWRKDEFGWGGNNNHGKFYYKGVFMFEYGLPRYGAYALRQAEAGSGGNGDTGYLTQVGQTIRCYNGGEWGNGVPGINLSEYHDFLPSLIEYAPVALTQWTAATVRPGYSLMNAERWTSSTNPYTRLTITDNQDILQRDGVSKRILFENTDNAQSGQGLVRCALNPLSSDLSGWVLDGRGFLRQADNQYQHSYRQVVDAQGRVIFRSRRVDNGNGTHSYEVNDVVVATQAAPGQNRALYWFHDFFIQASSTGIAYKDSTYSGTVTPLDPQANWRQPTELQFTYSNNQNGGCLMGVANLRFLAGSSASTGGGGSASTSLTYSDAFPAARWPTPTTTYSTALRPYAVPNRTWEPTAYYHDGNKTLNANGEFVISGRAFADFGVACCLAVDVSSPVVLENNDFTGTPYQAFVSIRAPSITVRNNRCFGQPIPDGNDYSPGVFLDCDNYSATVKNLVVEHNYLTKCAGIRLQNMSDNTHKFLVRYNAIEDINTVRGTGRRDYKSSIQLLNCPSIWIDITRNQITNAQNKGNGEDQLNIYSAVGTADKPVRYFQNATFGAFSNDLSSGNNGFTGTGGTTDLASGGSLIPQFVYVFDNQFVRTANSGFNTAGGHDIYVYHNRIVTYGRFEDGSTIGQQSTGVAIFDYYQTGASNFYNNHTVNNLLGYFTWFNDRRDNFLGVADGDNLHLPDPITLDKEYYERQLWEQRKAGWLAADATAIIGNTI